MCLAATPLPAAALRWYNRGTKNNCRHGGSGRALMLFLCYPGCSTCAKAKAFLAAKHLDVTFRNIKTQPPTMAELQH